MTSQDNNPFPESRFPAESAQYTESVRLGRETMSKLSLAVCCLARDCGNRLDRTIQLIERTGEQFRDWKAYVVENDSTDDTAIKLHDWKRRVPGVTVRSIEQGKKKWGMVRDGRRGQDMADYRNECRELALACDFDVAMVVDADLAGWSLDGIAESFGRWGDWDVSASNGLRRDGNEWVQADAWAWRSVDWRPLPFKAVRNTVPPRGEAPIALMSAFGGMALYTASAYRAANYGGGDCEHVVFHRRLRESRFDRLFMNPSQIVVYRW